jgi:hypothetical protein
LLIYITPKDHFDSNTTNTNHLGYSHVTEQLFIFLAQTNYHNHFYKSILQFVNQRQIQITFEEGQFVGFHIKKIKIFVGLLIG